MSNTAQSRLDEAIRLHQAGSLDRAKAMYRALLADDPAHHESLHLLGLIAHQRGEAATAAALLGQAIALSPASAHYHANLGLAWQASGRLPEAVAALETAWSLRPDSAAIACNLGALLTDLGRPADAIVVLRQAVSLDPALPDAQYNLGNAFCAADQTEAALPAYAACLRLRPDDANAHFNLAHALARLGRIEDAADSYRAALRLDPDRAEAHGNLGVLLHQADRPMEAEAAFTAALRLRPDDHAMRCNLAAALLAMGQNQAAAARFAEVLADAPDHGTARLGLLMTHLPIVPVDEAEVVDSRAAYASELARLSSDAARPVLRAALAEAAFSHQPFFLPYQGGDDHDLQRQYGGLMHRLARPAAPLPPPPRPGEKLRIGIVSGFFHEHTIWTLFLRGWLEQLDRSRFRVFGFHTGTRRDSHTEAAARLCERFTAGARDPDAWRDAVLEDAPHILLYPEIGMDPVAARLAAQRLAPLQCAAWGHPVTTGLPSIDLFLSSDMMEGQGAQAQYTERLIRLPNLGIYCQPDPRSLLRPADRAAFGLRPDAIVYWSGQNPPKYQPRYDEVFPRIAQAVRGCQFVFIGFGRGSRMTRRLADRLDRAFARFGLDAATHCVILPQLSQAKFLAAAGLADVVLDTIGWSGGKSTLDLLETDPAIVTLEGDCLRARHTAAILRRIGAPETIADTVDDYVAVAVRLGRSAALRHAARLRVARGKHRVWRDTSAITAMEAVLEQAARTRATVAA